MATAAFRPGLEGVVAAETRLSDVDGEAGRLIIGGYLVEELAANATFEELAHLLWSGALPSPSELAALRAHLAARRPLPPATLRLLEDVVRAGASAMDALRAAAGTLGFEADDAPRQAETLVAQFPTVVAAYWRLAQGKPPVEPRGDLGHAANYLYMLRGEAPTDAEARALETYLNTVVDHGFAASTFAARVIVSTESDAVSAIVGAVGALKGPLHGGAPGPALDLVFEIGRADRAEAVLREKLERGERLMGFGHRVYKVRDPRADVLSAAVERLFRSDGDRALYELAKSVEATALRLLEEYKPGRRLQTNVEFYTALLLHGLGLPAALFTPTFAVSRVAGWTAHCLEQLRDNRIFRPLSAYVGETGLRWAPVDSRST